MNLRQRSYSGPSFRPSPLVVQEKIPRVVIVATAWGEPDAAQKSVDRIQEFLQMSEDPEATVIGANNQELSRIENRMRAGAMLANEIIMKTDNSQEYKSAVELAMIGLEKNMLHWVQIGCPHILLSSPKGLEPICYSPDWSWQMQQPSPLVGQALGLERSCHLNCGSYRLSAGQSVILISRSQLPAGIYALPDPDIDSVSRVLIDDDPNAAFWIATIQL